MLYSDENLFGFSRFVILHSFSITEGLIQVKEITDHRGMGDGRRHRDLASSIERVEEADFSDWPVEPQPLKCVLAGTGP